MLRRSDLSFRQEMKFRNELVNYLTDWVLHTHDENLNLSQEIQAISWYDIIVMLKGNWT